jgi:hypothetical protein
MLRIPVSADSIWKMEDLRLLEKVLADTRMERYEDFLMKLAQRAMKVGLTALPFLALMGCSIKQTVKPVQLTGEPAQVCIIKNEKVREGFLDAYTDALKAKRVEVKTLAETASHNECPTTSTYSANWGWDMALYMRYAEIKVYRSAAMVGEAVYDATWGGLRLDKFISAESKIRELVDELFLIGQPAKVSTSPKISAAPVE